VFARINFLLPRPADPDAFYFAGVYLLIPPLSAIGRTGQPAAGIAILAAVGQ